MQADAYTLFEHSLGKPLEAKLKEYGPSRWACVVVSPFPLYYSCGGVIPRDEELFALSLRIHLARSKSK